MLISPFTQVSTAIPLWDCNDLPLWRFALHTLFPLVGLLKCPYGLHGT